MASETLDDIKLVLAFIEQMKAYRDVVPDDIEYAQEAMDRIVAQVIVSKDRYAELLIREHELGKLEAGGVDNWQWYSESLNEGESMEDAETRIKKEVNCEK